MLKVICCILLILAAGPTLAVEAPVARATFHFLDSDPATGATITIGDKLYLHIRYESSVPVRFQVEAIRQEVVQEKSFTSSTPPYAAGRGEALVWIGFPVALRTDAIRVIAYDMQWQQIGLMSTPLVVSWSDHATGELRHLAPWVSPQLKQHRRVFDNTYDPQPTMPDPLFDLFFLFSIMAIPAYLLLQTRMLVSYRGEWRRAASAPLMTILPICLYSIFGLGFDTAYWVIFLFRFFPLAFLFLVIVWVIRWVYDHRQATPAPL